MALSTYTDLQSAVALWTNRNDLSPMIPDAIAMCEAELNQRLRTPYNENQNTSFSISSRYTALPADFVQMRRVILLDGSNRLEMSPLPQGGRITSNTDTLFYNIVNNTIEIPKISATLEISYYCKVPALASNSVNAILTTFPDVYLFGTCTQVGYFLDDASMVSKFEQKFERAVMKANQSRHAQLGSGLQVRVS